MTPKLPDPGIDYAETRYGFIDLIVLVYWTAPDQTPFMLWCSDQSPRHIFNVREQKALHNASKALLHSRYFINQSKASVT